MVRTISRKRMRELKSSMVWDEPSKEQPGPPTPFIPGTPIVPGTRTPPSIDSPYTPPTDVSPGTPPGPVPTTPGRSADEIFPEVPSTPAGPSSRSADEIFPEVPSTPAGPSFSGSVPMTPAGPSSSGSVPMTPGPSSLRRSHSDSDESADGIEGLFSDVEEFFKNDEATEEENTGGDEATEEKNKGGDDDSEEAHDIVPERPPGFRIQQHNGSLIDKLRVASRRMMKQESVEKATGLMSVVLEPSSSPEPKRPLSLEDGVGWGDGC